jgi:GR25 family glycosyltransferase involved in LPS biosynthesis
MTSKIDLCYINLDRAVERRAAIEQSIGRAGFSGRWSFFRVSAVSADSDLVRQTPGRNSGAYKGNFLSHMQCVEWATQSDAHLFVVEDDVMFCRETGPLVEQVIDNLPEESWDVLRTDITLMEATHLPKLYKLCVSGAGKSSVRLLDLRDFEPPYVGASAYIVNRRSKRRFINAMRYGLSLNDGRYDAPYDGYLCDLVTHGVLRGFLTVPFLTAPSFDEDSSQAPQMYADRPLPTEERMRRLNQVQREIRSAFRRLVWVGFKPDMVLAPSYASGNALFDLSEQDMLYQKLASWLLMIQYNIPYPKDLKPESIGVRRAGAPEKV